MVHVEEINIPLSPSGTEKQLESTTGLVGTPRHEASFLLGTFLTTAFVFGIFFVQGILLARVLGPEGRGQFGAAVLFAQQLLLYVGLFGGIEIVNRYAKKDGIKENDLKYSAVSLGWTTGVITAVVSAILSVFVFGFVETDKAYLIPFCLLTCLFVPFEHVHLIVSGVDRGTDSYDRYNFNRLIYAMCFPLLLLALFMTAAWFGDSLLLVVCCLFVTAKVVGLLPTLRGLSFAKWWNRPKQQLGVTAPSHKKLMREGTPYAWSMFATELFERLDVLLIVLLAPIKETGFYFVAVPAAALLTIGPNALSIFTFNAGAAKRKIGVQQAGAIVMLTAVFQLFSLAVLWLLIPRLIVLFYGGSFEPAIEFVWYLLPACAIKGFLQPLDGYLKGCGKPFVGVWSRATSIVAMLGFVYFAYEKFDLVSIPMAACLGQFISMLIITAFVFYEVSSQNSDSEQAVI